MKLKGGARTLRGTEAWLVQNAVPQCFGNGQLCLERAIPIRYSKKQSVSSGVLCSVVTPWYALEEKLWVNSRGAACHWMVIPTESRLLDLF